VKWIVPRGAFYVFADIRAWLGRSARGVVLRDDIAVASWLIDEVRLAVVPGVAFGTPGFLRLSFAASLGEIDDAIACLRVLASELK
jgi:aspartate aminotransferase